MEFYQILYLHTLDFSYDDIIIHGQEILDQLFAEMIFNNEVIL